MFVTLGQTKGQTLLPLPPSDGAQEEVVLQDKDKIHILESAVVTWTRQIKQVLKADPEAAFKVSGGVPAAWLCKQISIVCSIKARPKCTRAGSGSHVG